MRPREVEASCPRTQLVGSRTETSDSHLRAHPQCAFHSPGLPSSCRGNFLTSKSQSPRAGAPLNSPVILAVTWKTQGKPPCCSSLGGAGHGAQQASGEQLPRRALRRGPSLRRPGSPEEAFLVLMPSGTNLNAYINGCRPGHPQNEEKYSIRCDGANLNRRAYTETHRRDLWRSLYLNGRRYRIGVRPTSIVAALNAAWQKQGK